MHREEAKQDQRFDVSLIQMTPETLDNGAECVLLAHQKSLIMNARQQLHRSEGFFGTANCAECFRHCLQVKNIVKRHKVFKHLAPHLVGQFHCNVGPRSTLIIEMMPIVLTTLTPTQILEQLEER